MRKITKFVTLVASFLPGLLPGLLPAVLPALAPAPASAQVTIKGSTVVTGGGNTGNNLATYSHPGNVAGGVCYVSPYTISSDAFAAMNACTAQLPATGGTIDATALGTANYSVTTPLTALNQASPSSVTLLLNSGTIFTLNQVLGTTKDPANCAVPVGGYPGSGSSIVVQGHSKFAGNFLLGSSFVGWGGICNGNFTGTQESLLLDGVTIQGTSSATVAGALMYLAGVFVPTRITNSGTYQCFAQCLEIDAASGGSSTAAGNILLDNDLFTDGYSGSATYPGSVVKIDALTNQGEITNIFFLGGAIQDNGPFNPLLVVNGRGGVQTGAISFLNTYFETAPASPSSFWTNVDPIQLADTGQIIMDPLRVQGAINPSSQANLVDISGTAGLNASFGINLNQVSVFTAAGFTRIINNTVEGTSETGFPNGHGDTALPNYEYGQVVPQIRQTNTLPPTSVGVCVIGSLWTNSAAASTSTTIYICAGAPGLQTYQALAGGGGGGSGVVNNGLANQLGEYPAAGSTIGGGAGLFAITPAMTQTQINSLFSGLSGQNSVFIPAGSPQVGYTNSGNQVPHDFRLGADYFQLPGAACDGKFSSQTIAITSGNNTSTVGSLLSAADVGKTFFFTNKSGSGFGFTQSVWTAKLTGYTFPTATWSANAPFNENLQVYYGTDNLVAINAATAQASALFPLTIPTGCLMLAGGTIPWNAPFTIVGRHLNQGGFIGVPGKDVIATTDTSGQSISSPGTGLARIKVVTGNDVDATFPINYYAADGTLTTQAAMYRPAYMNTPFISNDPRAPGWNIGGVVEVASTTQNSAVICTPNALTPPAVGAVITFPYGPKVFSTTVASTAGSCSAGFTARTMTAALPNISSYTVAQNEFITSTSVQTTTTTIPGTPTYPFTLQLSNAIKPVPGFVANFAQMGHAKIQDYEFDYMGANYLTNTIVVRRGPATVNGGAGYSGTNPVVALNPCPAKFDNPWPVTPTLNSGDSTPSGANFFPGQCVGNAGIAFPQANGNTFAGTGLVDGFLDDIQFQVTNPTIPAYTSTAQIYIAGNNNPFGSYIHNLKGTGFQFGLVEGPASYGMHGVAAVGPTGFGNTIDHIHFFDAFPLAFDDMQGSQVDELNLNSTQYSPYDGTAIGSATCLQEGGTFDEQTGSGVTSTQFNGHHVYGCEPEGGSHIVSLPAIIIDSSHATFDTANFEGVPNVVAGDHFKCINCTLSRPIIDYGDDNDFGTVDGGIAAYVTNVWDGTQQFLEWGRNSSCASNSGSAGGPPVACGASLVQGYQGRGIEASVTGSKPYFALGGMITPWMWDSNGSFDTNPFTKSGTSDPSAHYWGASSQCALGGAAICHTSGFNGFNGYLYIGPFNQLYDGPYVLDATFKSVSASSSFTLLIKALDSGSGQCASPATLYNATVSTTTSYGVVKVPVDMTGEAGCVLDVTYLNGSTTDTILTDRFNFVPQPLQVLLPIATPTVGAACAGPNAIIGSNGTNPLYCLSNLVVAGGGGTSGITQLTGDVVAGPGSGSVATTVGRIGGGTVLSTFTGLLQNTAGVVSQATSVSVSGVVQSGTRLVSALNAVTFSATPSFDLSLGNTQILTLTGNVSSSTAINPPGIGSTQRVDFIICQDATGGRTWTWPAAFQGVTPVTLAPSGCTSEFFNATTTSGGTTYLADNYNSAFANSSASPSLAGQAYRGYFSIPAGTNPTVVVDTTAVGAQSVILLQFDESIGLAMSPTVTCNTTPLQPVITAKAVGVSFTTGVTGTVSTNPVCVAFTVVNP